MNPQYAGANPAGDATRNLDGLVTSRISAGSDPAVSMSHMSRHICLCYQWPLYGPGNSTRHECDTEYAMDKPVVLDGLDPAQGLALLREDTPEDTPEQRRRRLFWRFMFEQQLAWIAGDTLAITKCLLTCRIHHEPLPRWLADATIALICNRMPAAEQQQQSDFAMHKIRWEAVRELHERHMTLEECRPVAADMLAGTEAAGAGDTIRDSYRLIERAGGERATLDSYRAAVRRRDRSTRTRG
jgi:hypothetical protein